MTAMLEGRDEDRMEAIDSLRDEYEEHCRAAVEQTKRWDNQSRRGNSLRKSVRTNHGAALYKDNSLNQSSTFYL